MSESKWKAYIQGKKYGPVDEEAIASWVREGRVTEKTQLWCPGMAKWEKAGEIQEFAQLFGGPVAPAPAPEEPAVEAAFAEVAADTIETGETPAQQGDAPAEDSGTESLDDTPAEELVDDEAATVIQESPFAEIAAAIEEKAAAEEPAAAPKAEVTLAAAQWSPAESAPLHTSPAPSPRPKPATAARAPLPLLPFLFSILALLAAGLLAFSLLKLGMFEEVTAEVGVESVEDLEAATADIDIDDDDDTPAAAPAPAAKSAARAKKPAFFVALGVGFGLLLLLVLPLTFSRAGLVGGLAGSVIALGSWVAVFVLDKPAGFSALEALKAAYIAQFQGDVAQIVSGVMSWLLVLVPLLALLYYASSRKYRARIAR